MNTMEITKFVGAICGSLLVFLLIKTGAESIYFTKGDVVAFSIAVEEDGGDAAEPAPAEEIDYDALMASADAGAGANVFRRCSACHVLEAGANRVGPYLHGVVGRDIAAATGFNFSAALSGIEGVWDYEHLFAFIRNPREYAPGTAMAFAGISNPQEIANLIAYMEAESN